MNNSGSSQATVEAVYRLDSLGDRGQYVDKASAFDLRNRTTWRRLIDQQAARHKVDLIVLWRIDRGFRSVHEAATILERLRGWHVGLRSYPEPWHDTTSAVWRGPVLHHRHVRSAREGIIAERVRAGMARAK